MRSRFISSRKSEITRIFSFLIVFHGINFMIYAVELKSLELYSLHLIVLAYIVFECTYADSDVLVYCFDC